MFQASTRSAGTSKTPTLRVAAARNPAAAAAPHRPRRAHQKHKRDARRKRDSLYGERKKKLAGKHAKRRTVRFAIETENSNVVRANRTMSAARNAALETRVAAPVPPRGSAIVTARIASGYPGKKAALASLGSYPSRAILSNQPASQRSVPSMALCHPGVAGTTTPEPAELGGRTVPTVSTASKERSTRTPMKTATENPTPSRRRTGSAWPASPASPTAVGCSAGPTALVYHGRNPDR